MRRERVNARHSPERLAELYAEPNDHTPYDEHVERIATVIEIARDYGPWRYVADLSCGKHAAITNGLVHANMITEDLFLGDFAPGYEFTGPVEETAGQLPSRVDLFVLSETLEHLDDPDLALREVRSVTDMILLSTPDSAWDDAGNEQHYWAYDGEYLTKMLRDAGFATILHSSMLHKTSYTYRIILAK